MDVFAWVEDKREEGRNAFFSFLTEQRQIWTPPHIFNRCCVKWLADGDLAADDGYGYFDEYSHRNGCDGSRCNRDHPTVTLRFDVSSRATVATMSHRLDPFVQYFNGRVSQGTAWPHSPTEYQLDGYIRANLTDLRSQQGFGGHLVTMESGSLDASDSAQREEQEEQERATKRQRVDGVSDASFVLFEEAIDIALKERLQKDLENDFMSLFCLRSTSKYLKTVATSIATEKITTLSVSLTLLTDGREQFGEGTGKLDGYDEETWDVGCWDPCDPQGVVVYDKSGKIEFVFRESQEGSHDGAFYPIDTAASAFTWKSGKLRHDSDEVEDVELGYTDDTDYAYSGQLMRAYWHPSQFEPVTAPTRTSMYGQIKPTLGILMGEFYVKKHPKLGPTTKKKKNGVTLDYEVIRSTAEEETVKGEEGESERLVEYQGEIKINKMNIDFGFLVRQHAKAIKRKLSMQHSEIQKQRPLTQSEIAYMKLVGLAAQNIDDVLVLL